TVPSAHPPEPADELLGQPCGPRACRVGVEQVAKPCGCNLVPEGSAMSMPSSGEGASPYSVPEIFTEPLSAAPAPGLVPVPGKPGIGATEAFSESIVGVARAAAASPRAIGAVTSRQRAQRNRIVRLLRKWNPLQIRGVRPKKDSEDSDFPRELDPLPGARAPRQATDCRVRLGRG